MDSGEHLSAVEEVYCVSDSGNKESNCSIYDVVTGGLIDTFKEGNSIRNGLAFIADDFLISAFKNRPILKVWTVGLLSREECHMTCPGIVSALAVSNCGSYCIAGIDKSIYVWEVSSGNQLACITYHMQAVTCLRFSSDGSHFISGGKDGIVLVWLLLDTIATSEGSGEQPKPRFTWMDHAAEVADIFVGSLGFYARVVTVSKDMTCRIYELETGNLLTTMHVDFPITAVTMDIAEYFLFLGSADGSIFKINLFANNEADVHYENAEKKFAFLGHSHEITSLSVSSTRPYLISGSADKDCRIWDMTNYSCVRKLPCMGPVTNAFFTLVPPGLKDKKRVPRTSVNLFKKTTYADADEEENDLDFVTLKLDSKKLSLLHLGTPDDYFEPRVLNCSSESLEIMMRGNLSVEDMSRINNSMYAFTLGDSFYEAEAEADSESDNEESESSN